MKTESAWLVAQDQQQLHVRIFRPDGPPKACIAMVHGFGEHTGRYERSAAFFCARGYAYVIHDQRGHGLTPGKRGVVRTYASLMSDIDLVLDRIGKNFPGLPIALYGHSMGGNEVLFRILHAPALPASVKCAVAGSPWLRLHKPPSAATVAMAKIVSKILPDFTAKSDLKIEELNRSKENQEATRNDPLYLDAIGARIFQELSANGERILAEEPDLHIPLLVMVGTGDLVVSHEAVQEFIAKCGDRCESRIWPGFFHELHNEPEAEEVLGVVAEFLDRRLAGA